MRIIVVGVGHVGATIVETLHAEHELAVVDLDALRLQELSNAFDVRTVTGHGASREVLLEAGVAEADLVMACTARDEVNLVAAALVRRLSKAKTIVRTREGEYLDAWRDGDLDVDYMVSSELQTGTAVAATVSVPAARATDILADGQVQVAEFDIAPAAADCGLVGVPLAQAPLPDDSTVAAIVRAGTVLTPRGDATIAPGDRVFVIGSPHAAREWSRTLAPDDGAVEDVVLFGAGRAGVAIARFLLARGIHVRIVDPDLGTCNDVATALPRARIFHGTGLDREFLRQERIGQASAVVTAMGDDAKNLYAATPFTIGLVDDPTSSVVFDRAGIDVAINPRTETAEEMIRFAHDPRTRQVVILDDDRFEVLDIVVRAQSELAGRRFADLPATSSAIGALIRDGRALFPHGDDELRAGDRAIVLVESVRASQVEKAL
jgi:trk system potassium uptake protein TrkA